MYLLSPSFSIFVLKQRIAAPLPSCTMSLRGGALRHRYNGVSPDASRETQSWGWFWALRCCASTEKLIVRYRWITPLWNSASQLLDDAVIVFFLFRACSSTFSSESNPRNPCQRHRTPQWQLATSRSHLARKHSQRKPHPPPWSRRSQFFKSMICVCIVDEVGVAREANLERRKISESRIRPSRLQTAPHAPNHALLYTLQLQLG